MAPKPITKNTLFYGDNLLMLREHIADESVDLVYLDPPFNSNRSYNVLFKDESGQAAEAQITAFEGIDGVITFIDDASGKPKRVLIQVKSGGVSSQTIRDLRGTVEREQAAIGVLLTLEPATKPMEVEAATAGFYESPAWGKKYPRLQILTIEHLLRGAQVQMPPAYGTFKQAQKVKRNVGTQGGFDLEP